VTFFAVNAASFFVSGLLIGRVRRRGTGRQPTAEAGIREGFAALRPRPVLAIGVLVLGVAVTISAGRWIAGVPMLVRDHLHGGAGAFSVVMVATPPTRSSAARCSRIGRSVGKRWQASSPGRSTSPPTG
jgi:hypothetical protein